MDINEQQYLEATERVLEKKVGLSACKLKKAREKLKKGIKEQGSNFSDLTRGEDLANSYTSLGLLQEEEMELELENKRLEIQSKNPYFARIDFTPYGKKKTQNIYIGIGNVIDDNKLYVADWRAPISSMYYDYSLGDASFSIADETFNGRLELKRQFKIDDGNLVSYFDTDLTINDDILQEILSQNVSIKMKQIVSTIQKEQNSIVRNDTNENMLVQGIAGSGKTSIALHRAAYLLYKHRKTIKSSDITIVSPNNIFSSYISDVLPQLGEDNLVETTFAQLARAELKKGIQNREEMLDEIATSPSQELLNEISYKSSYEYLDDLLRFLKGPFLETYSPQTLKYLVSENMDGEKEYVEFTAEQTSELFFKTFKGYDLYERINKIAWQYAMYFTEKRHYSKEQNRALRERFKNILYKFLPVRDTDKVFEIFMAREGYKVSKNKKISYMDKGTFMAIKHFIYGIDHDFSAKYLIIDEMQDFTPVDFYMFKKIWACPKIMVGDVHQCIEKNVTDEYLTITADFLGCKLLKLNKTYRSTKEIAKFANHLVGLDDIEFVNRSGSEPAIYQTENQAKAIKEIIEKECKNLEHIAIVCKCHKEAELLHKKLHEIIDCKLLVNPEDYSSRVLITSCATAKGIEFDAVIIPNCDNENYRNTVDKNIIYVSSTRALHKLYFTCSKTPSTFIKDLNVINC